MKVLKEEEKEEGGEREKKKRTKGTKICNAQRTTLQAQIFIFGYVVNIKT